jgi:hypothetical protein
MAQTCSNCAATVVNDDPAIKHPLEFLQALKERGWFIPSVQPPSAQQAPPRCPKCASS